MKFWDELKVILKEDIKNWGQLLVIGLVSALTSAFVFLFLLTFF